MLPQEIFRQVQKLDVRAFRKYKKFFPRLDGCGMIYMSFARTDNYDNIF